MEKVEDSEDGNGDDVSFVAENVTSLSLSAAKLSVASGGLRGWKL